MSDAHKCNAPSPSSAAPRAHTLAGGKVLLDVAKARHEHSVETALTATVWTKHIAGLTVNDAAGIVSPIPAPSMALTPRP